MFQNIFITNRTADEESTVYIWDDERGLLTYPYSKFDYAYKLDVIGDKETIFGDRVSKTYNWSDNARDIFESDVPRETRVLTDLYLDSDDVAKDHRTLIFDIEVARVKGAYANVERADGKITAISCYADVRDEYIVFLLDESHRFNPPQQINGNRSIIAFETEEEMLQAFLTYYTDYSPTILSGWNICGYDVPYIYKRLSVILDYESACMLSPIGMIKFSKMRKQYQIAGVSCLDYFQMYQKFTFSRRPSYRLHDIGMYEVDLGKIEYEGSLDDLYENDLPLFIDYNLRDTEIVRELDNKMKLIDLVKNISHVGHTQYEDYMYSSKYIEGTILTYLHRQGRIASNKHAGGREEFEQRLEDDEEGFKGAYVQEPVPGLYDWVYNLDLQSLYPSIIMSLNISPETKIGFVKNWNLEEHIKKTATHYIVEIGSVQNVLTRDQFMEFMQQEKFMISSNGVLFRSDKLGVIPEILDVWFKQRLEYKELMKQNKQDGNAELASYYDRRQHVQKILLNSIYGVLGLPIFRFYDLDNALAVTSTGQDIIKTSAKYVNQIYQRFNNTDTDYCIYIDTDSLYFPAEPMFNQFMSVQETGVVDKLKLTIMTAEAAAIRLNKFYDVMSRNMFFCNSHRFVIKGEAISKTAFWVAKKRYAMWKVYDLENNSPINPPKMGIKGLDAVRSSFPPAFQKFTSNCLLSILNKEQKDVLDNMILTFRTEMNDMEFKQIAKNTSVQSVSEYDNKKDTGFTKFPKGAPAHVKAAVAYNRWLRMNKLDKQHTLIRNGDKIKWAYLKPNPMGMPTMALKGYDDPQELVDYVTKYIDYDVLFEKDLHNKLEDFYKALGWGMVPTKVNQTINEFFNF